MFLLLYLYSHANKKRFEEAIDDFKAALKLDSEHKNAKKYLASTHTAFAREYVCFTNSNNVVYSVTLCVCVYMCVWVSVGVGMHCV